MYTHFASLTYIDPSDNGIHTVETKRACCKELACMWLADVAKQFIDKSIIEMSVDKNVFWKAPEEDIPRIRKLLRDNYIKVGCNMHKLKALYDYYEADFNKH